MHFLSIRSRSRRKKNDKFTMWNIQRLLRHGAAAPAGGRKEEEEETMAPVVMDRRRLRGALLFSFYFI